MRQRNRRFAALLLSMALLTGCLLPVTAADDEIQESAADTAGTGTAETVETAPEAAAETEDSSSATDGKSADTETSADTEDSADAEGSSEEDSAEEAEEETVYEILYIETAEDLLSLAESCRLDTWSQDKQVELLADIDLGNAEFTPISSFGGIFDGNGYTISGLYITQSCALAGLFAEVQTDAVIRDLSLSGTVSPAGSAEATGGIAAENYGLIQNCSFSGSITGTENTGGIAGINALTGQITGCTVSGAIFGDSMTGGIAGASMGTIRNCSNSACVNIDSGDETISLTDLDLSGSDLTGTTSDTGGIAGYSSGILSNCSNTAAIGYPHVGYNVGGIAGRSCGSITDCENSGAVQGRKDVGGIAGQMEPYIAVEITADLLADLESTTAELQEKTESILEDADAANAAASDRLEDILDDLDDLSEALENFRIYGSISGSVSGGASAGSSISASADPGGVDTSVSVGTDNSVSVETTDPSVSVDTSSGYSSDLSIDSGLLSGLDIGTSSSSSSGVDTSVSIPDVDTDISSSISASASADPLESSAGVSSETQIGAGASASAQLTVTTSMSEITAALNSLTSEVRLMEEELSEQGYTMTDELREVSDRIEEMTDDFVEALENPDDTISDTSVSSLETATLGKLADCENTGVINGDLNTGGIAGAMAIEYTLDPEDDLSADPVSTQRRNYELTAIIFRCRNTGTVTGRRSNAGGICGLMQLGLITDCENYGDVSSESGDQVGGIAGLTSATVRNSFVKCSLSGGSAVGGIVGSGTAEDLGGDSSLVAQNYAMVQILEAEQYAGAIGGMDEGEFSENFFVSDTLAGLAGLSRSGQAEAISYEELCEVEGLPEEFRSFTLTFTADDTVLKTVEFVYGESFSSEIWPEIPEKDGYYGEWDTTVLEDLHFDTEVSVIYTRFHSALTTGSTRDNGRQIFYVQGDFENGDSVTASVQVRTPAAFGTLSTGFSEALESYFEQLENQSWLDAGLNREIVEQWYLEIPDDGQTVHEIRYLPPDGQTENLEVYVQKNGEWEWVESEFTGSYLTFELRGSSGEIAILSTTPLWWAWVLLAILLLLILAGILILLFRHRRKRKAAQSPTPPEEPAGTAASPSPATQQEAQLLQRALDAERRLAGKEAALQILQNGGTAEEAEAAAAAAENAVSAEPAGPDTVQADAAAPAGKPAPGTEPAADPAEPQAGKPEKHRRRLLLWILGAAAIAVVVLALLFGGTLYNSITAWNILRSYTGQDDLAMDITISASVGSADLETEATLYRTETEDEEPVSCITQDGVTVFYADGALYLENGTSFALGSLIPDYADLLEIAVDLFRTTDLTRETDDDSTVWTLTAEGDSAAELLEILLPEAENAVSTTQTMRVELEAEDGELTALRFRADGTLTDAGQTAFSVKAEAAAITDSREAKVQIPDAVLEAIESADSAASDPDDTDDTGTEETGSITSDLLFLVSVWGSLYSQDVIAADMTLSADLGPLQISETLEYYETALDGQTVRSIRKNRLNLYFTDDAICDAEGNTADLTDTQLTESAELLNIVYTLCMNGEFSCEGDADSRVYALSLDEEGMQAVTLAIAPDAADLAISFSAGEITVTVEDSTLQQIQIEIDGAVDLVLAQTDIAVGAELVFTENTDFSVPDAVAEALLN